MRRFLVTAGCGLAAGFASAQSGSSLIESYSSKLHESKSFVASYRTTVIGEQSDNYSIRLSKPNMARFESPKTVTVADGKSITFFDKARKTYYSVPQTDAALLSAFNDNNAVLWSPFFKQDVFSKTLTPKYMGQKSRRGMDLSKVEAHLDGRGRYIENFYFDKDLIARQAEINEVATGAVLLIDTQSVEASSTPLAAETLAFKAPEGSREISLEELTAGKWYEDLEIAKGVAASTHRLLMVDFGAVW